MKRNGGLAKAALLLALTLPVLAVPAFAAPMDDRAPKGFERGIVITLDGIDYYLAGPPDVPGGARDVPGHYWAQLGHNQLQGKHYNTGPFGAPQWWSSDAGDGELLYVVHAVIAPWTEESARAFAARGYVHYHELVRTDTGELHPYLVVWLRHTARTSFTLDGGPHPEYGHAVSPGIDYEFINNWFMPYPS